MKITTLSQCAGGGHTHIHVEDDDGKTRTVTVNTSELFATPAPILTKDEEAVQLTKEEIEKAGARTFEEAKQAIEAAGSKG